MVCWKLVWSGGFYQRRISVPLFTLLRSHSPHSARRQMSPENLANMAEMRFVIASWLWPRWHTNSRSGEVCAFDFQCWSVFLRWHLFVSQQVFFMMQIHKCCHVCVPFVKQLHCIKQPHRRCLCGLCIWIDSFFSSVANIVLYAGRQTANPICLQSQQTASKAT